MDKKRFIKNTFKVNALDLNSAKSLIKDNLFMSKNNLQICKISVILTIFYRVIGVRF